LLSIKREAYSSAYYIAGVVCGDKLSEMRKKYYIRAITRCPWKYPFEYRERFLVILREFAGPFYHLGTLLVRFIGKLKHLIRIVRN
jgi:hypothetical protein